MLRLACKRIRMYNTWLSVCEYQAALVAIHGASGRFIGRLWANVWYHGVLIGRTGHRSEGEGDRITVSINRRRKMSSRGFARCSMKTSWKIFDIVPFRRNECAAVIRDICHKGLKDNLALNWSGIVNASREI